MKKTKLLSLILAFLMMLSSVWVFAEAENTTPDNGLNPGVEATTPTYGLNEEQKELRDNIAVLLATAEDGWSAFDMALYSGVSDGAVQMDSATRQKIINAYISEASTDNATASDRARIEIVLRALGADTKNLYTYNSNDVIDNAKRLKESDLLDSHYSAPWVLLADIQGNTQLSDEQKEALVDLLAQNSANGTFGYEWGGVTYSDPDTAAVTLAATAPMYNTNEAAKALADSILSALDTMIQESGSFGSANSDAMVIIGLIAMGRNPADLKHETSGKTVIDGLLSYVNEAKNGFTFYGADNFMATEQGFRALVALSYFEGEAVNIYDFSEKQVAPTRQENAEIAPPVVPDDDGEKINVTITIKSDTEYWIDSLKVKIPAGGTVYDAFSRAIESERDMSAVGAEKGYVRSITKDDVTLSEFDKGTNSGWLYKVNGEKPSVGLTDYVLSSGDKIVWYYTEDWRKEAPDITGGGGSGYGGGSSSKPSARPEEKPDVTESEKEPEITEPETVPEESVKVTFDDINSHWSEEAVKYVTEKGIMNGVEENRFAPDEKLTRGMLVVMLLRLSEDSPKGENAFTDIANDAWYKDAAVWAKENGIADGYTDGSFGAEDEVTREQLVVLLMRYAKVKQLDTSFEDGEFKDADEISDWAKDAAIWAKSSGIVSGRENDTFDPKAGATRGEIAAVFMRFCEKFLK